MKTFFTVLAALTMLGAASAASATQITNDKGQTYWEQLSRTGG